MVGATEDEGASMFAGTILSVPKLITEMNADWENVAPKTFDYGKYLSKDEQTQVSEKLKQFYFGGSEISVDSAVPLTNVYSDEIILHGVYRSAIETVSRGKRNPVYLYQYAYKGPTSLMGSTFHIKGLDESSNNQFTLLNISVIKFSITIIYNCYLILCYRGRAWG